MSTQLRWGILGTGNIARQFVTGVRASRRGTLAAVASRAQGAADEFARKFEIPVALGDYPSLFSRADVDAVYISLPNSMHHQWTLAALSAGKHVLCEKPISVVPEQAREMFALAESKRLTLVEAFMYRSHPLTRAVLETLASGVIGTLQIVRTSFCFHTSKIDGNIRFDPTLAGGALMDIGCYCIDFSRLVAGCEPIAVHAQGRIHPRGVDDIAAGTMVFPNGILASFTCGMAVQLDNTAYLGGDRGYIEVPIPWKPPSTGATYIVTRGIPPRMDNPAIIGPPPRDVRTVDANGELYGIEADAFAATVLDGAPPAVTGQHTIGNITVLQTMRRYLGLAY
jgi:predicted dehydrogenase